MARPEKDRTLRRRSEKNLAYRISAGAVIPLIRAITNFDVRNPEALPREGGFILAPNHTSEIDPLVVGTIVYRLGRAPHFLAKEAIFRVPVIGAAMRGMHQVPVFRTGRDRSASIRAANELAERGHCVIVYPEGSLTRDPDFWPMRGKSGAVRLALDSGLPIIPMAQVGSEKILPRYGKKLHVYPRTLVTAVFGEPMDLAEYRGRPVDQKVLSDATAEVMQQITALLETLRGEKAPVKRWNPVEHGQTETGRF